MDEIKQEQIKVLLNNNNLDVLLIQRVSSFAWATCGAASYVNTAATTGEATLLITPTGRHLITNNIEATRLEEEEKLVEQGWAFHVTAWHETNDIINELSEGLTLGADVVYQDAADLSSQLAQIRADLTAQEGVRFRVLGKLCAEAMNAAARSINPGQSEYEIAGILALETEKRGVQVVVNLIATDDRIYKFRHPFPTQKKLQRYAMLVLSGRQKGLVCSITRLIHFGQLPQELRGKAHAVVEVDARFIVETKPGVLLGEILKSAQAAYAAAGYPEEWQLHYQCGPAGYEPREYIATPGSTEVVKLGQVYA